MKAIMYHYVREAKASLPYFRYLHLEDFRRQLDLFESEYGFVSLQDLTRAIEAGDPALVPRDGVILTFDDGFADHYDFVFPELVRRNLWGAFYVSTAMFETGKPLDVHRIHILLGRFGGSALLEAAQEIVDEEMLVDRDVEAFRTHTYTRQDNDAATDAFKRMLNYFISYQWREEVLDRLCDAFLEGGWQGLRIEDIYMNMEQLREMQAAGMLIGSHGYNHLLLSKLRPDEQQDDIHKSFAYLESGLGQMAPRSFCYPYGGAHSFTPDTERILDDCGCRFTFNVEGRDITPDDLLGRPQALPRYDCNLFPHGKASMGDKRPGN